MSVLVAGIGNIFMGDDGFGCEVIRQLAHAELPAGVDVVDFGIRGMDLGYALMDGGYELAVLVDTVAHGGAPGTVYVIEPELDADARESTAELLSPHGMDPDKVLHFIAALGERGPRVLLVACEPADLGGEAGHMGLSDAVQAAVAEAAMEVVRLLSANTPTADRARAKRAAIDTPTRSTGAIAPGGTS